MIDYSQLAFPKGNGNNRREKGRITGVHETKDGREICLKTASGRIVWRARVNLAWKLFGRVCPYCMLYCQKMYLTGDHRFPRGAGGGKRRDNLSNILPMHIRCNNEKGSRIMPEVLPRAIQLIEACLAWPLDVSDLSEEEHKIGEKLLSDLKEELARKA